MRRYHLVIWAIAVTVAGVLMTQFFKVGYVYFAGTQILQFIILATAWNLLGGYVGYVNFGVAAFFGLGAYTAAVMILFLKLNIFFAMLAGGIVSGILGLGIGYLTLRLRGIFFAIATLAMAVIIQMFIVNTPSLGGSRGLYVIRPQPVFPFDTYSEFLFVILLMTTFLFVAIVRFIEKSWIGMSFTAIKDSEEAAECCGVPVFKLKLLATSLSGFMMGVAGATFPYYVTYLSPYNSMGLDLTVNSLAMPLVGGTGTWLGPIVGGLLIGFLHQFVTVFISSDLGLMFSGILLITFVIIAPEGLVGLFRKLKKGRSRH